MEHCILILLRTLSLGAISAPFLRGQPTAASSTGSSSVHPLSNLIASNPQPAPFREIQQSDTLEILERLRHRIEPSSATMRRAMEELACDRQKQEPWLLVVPVKGVQRCPRHLQECGADKLSIRRPDTCGSKDTWLLEEIYHAREAGKTHTMAYFSDQRGAI